MLQEIDDIIDNEDDEDEEDDYQVTAPSNTDQPMPFLAPHSIRSSTFIGQALAGRKLEDLGVQVMTKTRNAKRSNSRKVLFFIN